MNNDALTKIKAAAEDLNRRDDGLRVEELPLEVRRGLGWWRATQLDRVFCVDKKTSSRSSAWAHCRKYGETINVVGGHDYTGWQSNHTTHYWVWWAQAIEEVSLEPQTVDEFIDRLWEEFKP
jgi:hypothetical protein